MSSSEAASGPNDLKPQAYIHYLLALRYANDHIPQVALREAAISLRIQPGNNPAAGLAFELITEQRQNVHIRFCCSAGTILQTRYSPDGKRVMTVLADRTIRVWDAHTGGELFAPLQHGDDVLAAAWSADGHTIASSSRDGKVHIWDAGTGSAVRTPLQMDKPLTHIAVSPDGKRVLGSHEGALFLLNAVSGEVLSPKPAYHDDINVVAFSDDGQYAMVATNDDVADLIDPFTGHRQHRMPQGNAVFSAVFSRDSRYALTASEDHTARIWATANGMPLDLHFEQSAAMSSARFSADGAMILTTSFDHTARIWDIHSSKPLSPLLQHSAPVVDGGFSADGKEVFTLGRDEGVRLWSVSGGEMISAPIHGAGSLSGAEFSPTEQELLVSSSGRAEIIDMPPGETAPEWLADLADLEAGRSRFDQGEKLEATSIEKLRMERLQSNQSDRWTQFGKWYFAAAGERTVSPWSQLPLRTYVEGLIRQRTNSSLDYAREISAGHSAWLVEIDAAKKKLTAAAVKNDQQ